MSSIAEKLPSKNEFLSVLNSVFSVHLPEGKDFDLCLVKVDEIVSNEIQENFTLLFKASVDAPPSQSIYRLEHDLGAMEIFLVPVKKDENGLYYEAVFNHLKAVSA